MPNEEERRLPGQETASEKSSSVAKVTPPEGWQFATTKMDSLTQTAWLREALTKREADLGPLPPVGPVMLNRAAPGSREARSCDRCRRSVAAGRPGLYLLQVPRGEHRFGVVLCLRCAEREMRPTDG
jgi:hypothetical protein